MRHHPWSVMSRLLPVLIVSCLAGGPVAANFPVVKVLVENDGLYRVTGKDLQGLSPETGVRASRVTDEHYGDNLLTSLFAASGSERDSPVTHPAAGLYGELTAVETKAEGLPLGAGRWCLRLEGIDSKGSMIRYNSLNRLKENTSYLISFLLYTEEPQSGFVVVAIPRIGDEELRATNEEFSFEDPVFFSRGKVWTRILARVDIPPGNGGKYALAIANWDRVTKDSFRRTWYVDELAFREIRSKEVGRETSGRSAEQPFVRLSGIVADQVNMYYRDITVPIDIVHAGMGGRFVPETEIRFAGEMAREKNGDRHYHANRNAYFLDFTGREPPNRFELHEDLSLMRDEAEQHPLGHIRTRHIEKDKLLRYKDHYVGSPTDRTFWKQFRYPGKDFEVEFDEISDYRIESGGMPAFIKLQLWGGSLLRAIEPDHVWKVVLNDTVLDQVGWDGKTRIHFEALLPDGVVNRDIPNRLEFRHEKSSELVPDVILLDWIELEYEAEMRPRDDYLELNLEASDGMTRIRTESGFTQGDIRIYDIDNGIRIENSGASGLASTAFHADFVVGAFDEPRRIAVVGPEGCREPDRLMVRGPNPLTDLELPPEYLLITHIKFMEAVKPLVEQRRRQGLSTLLVDVEDIYDHYSDGVMSPFAIQDMISEFKDKSSDSRKLRYVFLVGGATYDYREVTPYPNNFVPTIHSNVVGHLPEYAPLIAVDDFLGYQPGSAGAARDGTGDDYTISIGRLPSNLVESVEAYIEKVIDYEKDATATADDARALVIAAHGYHMEAEKFVENEGLDGFNKHLILAEADVNGADIQSEVIGTIDMGCDVVFFAGHGSWGIWKTGDASLRALDQTDMLTCRQVEQLSNKGRYPIVFATTCFSAIFDNPIGYSYDKRHNPTGAGIGVYFVESRLKGGIACIAHVGKTIASVPNKFAQWVINEMTMNGAERLGDAFVASKNRIPGYRRDIGYGIVLIGDPGLHVGERFRGVFGKDRGQWGG